MKLASWCDVKYNVVVVGGGPAGSIAAISLARSGVNVLLLEKRRKGHKKVGEILSSQLHSILRDVKLETAISDIPTLVLNETCTSWGDKESTVYESILDPRGGAIAVDRGAFEKKLLSKAEETGVVVVRGAKLVFSVFKNGCWDIKVLCQGKTVDIRSEIVIDATGRNSNLLNANNREIHDSLVGVCAYSDIKYQIPARFEIESSNSGWWYASPLPKNKVVIAFMTDLDCLPAGKNGIQKTFTAELERSSISLRRDISAKTFLIRMANSSIRRKISGPNYTSIGDAAASYDPLSGFGVTLSISKSLSVARLFLSEGAERFQKYEELEKDTFSDYLHIRNSVYSREERWRSNVFWSRRSAIQ